jgi:hypothetical protein
MKVEIMGEGFLFSARAVHGREMGDAGEGK